MAGHNVNILYSLVDRFSKPMENIANKTKDTERALQRSNNAFKRFGNAAGESLLKVGKYAATALGGAMAGVAGYSVKVGADFEEGMSKVAAISGASGEDLEKLTAKAKEMGATTKFSATEAAQAMQYMAMAGWKAGQMTDGIKGIMDLAAASGEDLASVSDIVTDALTAFGLKAGDAGKFADILAQASSSSNTNVSMMGETFKYVAPLAGALKYDVEDVAIAIGLMANAGVKGTNAGTALRSTFTRLAKPPKEAANAMAALGISITNADGSTKPLMETMEDLRDRFAGLTTTEKAQYAAQLAGQEAMSGFLAIVNASDEDFANLSKAITNSEGAASRMATTMNNNLKGQMKQFGSVTEAIGISIYDKFKTPLTNALKGVNGSLSDLNASVTNGDLAGKFEKLGENLGKITEALVNGLIVALPVVIDAFGWIVNNGDMIISILAGIATGFLAFKVASIFFTLQAALEGVSTATAIFNAILAMNPIGAVCVLIGALIAGAVMLWQNWDKVTAAIMPAWNAFKGFIDWVGSKVMVVLQPVIDGVKALARGISNVSKIKIFGGGTGEVEPSGDEGSDGENPPSHATGTSYFAGGETYVGEGGRGELITLPSGSQIIPHDNIPASNQSITVNLTIQGNLIGNEEFINECGRKITERLQFALGNI